MAEVAPIAILVEEHRLVQKAMASMVMLADRLETGRGVSAEAVRDAVDIMRLIYQVHEKREELYLFPALQRRGVSVHSVPTRALVEEHIRGRALVAALEKSASSLEQDPSARQSLVASLRGLAALYPLHIWQEDLLLFPQAEQALTVPDREELLRGFGALEEAAGGDTTARLQVIVEQMEKSVW